MKPHLLCSVLLLVCAPALAAQSTFTGTWKTDLSKSTYPTEPDVFILHDGRYTCPTCAPPIDVKADGTDQPVTGHPRYSTMRVDMVDARTVMITEKENGRVVQTLRTVISPDGDTAYWQFGSSLDTDHPVTGKGEDTRVGPGPAGSHIISGAWRTTKMEGVAEAGLLTTYTMANDRLTMSTPTGKSYTARLDGTEAPFVGDPSMTSVSVRLIDAGTIVEADRRDGQLVSVATLILSADGRTLRTVTVDKATGATSEEVADRQ